MAGPGSRRRLRGLPPEEVAEEQRRRILVAVGEATATAGFDCLSVTEIARSAGVSRRAIYELYGGKEGAFAAAHEQAFASLLECLEDAWAARSTWPHRVREALAAGLGFAVTDPAAARLVLADPFALGPNAAAYREQLFDLLTPALRRGRGLGAADPALALEEALLGGLLAVVAGHLREGRAASLPALAPTLTRLVLSPYVGAVEAERLAGEGRQ